MARTVNIKLDGLKGLVKELPKWSDMISKEVADRAPEEIIDNIKAGKTGIFPGSNLPRNKPSTIRRKQAKGQGNKSLIADKVLTTERKWSTRKTGKGYVVLPPSERREVVKYLRDGIPGGSIYKILEIPIGFIPRWVKKMVSSSFGKLIKKYA